MRLNALLSVLVSSVLVAEALPAEQAVFLSLEDASLLSELSMFEGRVEDEEPIWMTEREKILAKPRSDINHRSVRSRFRRCAKLSRHYRRSSRVNRDPFLPSPGADDDGSGTISILEAYRVLLESEYIPTTPVEFHWYAAEETGLLGSQDIVQSYAEAGTLVKGQQQFDMTAWIHKDFEEVVGICINGVDSDLTEFNRGLVERYLSIPWRNTICPYGCSDHQSWEHAGYKASASFEDLFEHMKPTAGRHVHDIYDTTDHPESSFAHVLEFSKLAVAFVVELGGFEGKE